MSLGQPLRNPDEHRPCRDPDSPCAAHREWSFRDERGSLGVVGKAAIQADGGGRRCSYGDGPNRIAADKVLLVLIECAATP